MLEHTWYSVISPESCSSILWRSWEFKEKAAEVLKLTAEDMYANKLVDGIIPEPLGGAHHDPQAMAETMKARIIEDLEALKSKDIDTVITERIEKFCAMGVVIE
jgi:acetyl-CoA carboxylase carboxyl transferase subunit alpha